MKTNEVAKAVWIVVGETGEYSDYSQWHVAAFTTESEAVKCQTACQAEADIANRLLEKAESQLTGGRWGSDNETSKRTRGEAYDVRNRYDPQYALSYTGTHYSVEMIEVSEQWLPE